MILGPACAVPHVCRSSGGPFLDRIARGEGFKVPIGPLNIPKLFLARRWSLVDLAVEAYYEPSLRRHGQVVMENASLKLALWTGPFGVRSCVARRRSCGCWSSCGPWTAASSGSVACGSSCLERGADHLGGAGPLGVGPQVGSRRHFMGGMGLWVSYGFFGILRCV